MKVLEDENRYRQGGSPQEHNAELQGSEFGPIDRQHPIYLTQSLINWVDALKLSSFVSREPLMHRFES